MSDTITRGHEQHDLYVSDTILNGVHHIYKTDLLDSYGSHSGGTIDGIQYSYSSTTKYWTISGTATSDSFLSILNSPYSIPSYINKDHEFQLELDSFSEGSIIPLRITLYFSSNTIQMMYPSNIGTLSYKVQSNSIKIPSDCIGLKVEYFIEKGREVSAQVLYHFYDIYDNRVTHYEYVDQSTGSLSTFQVVISGGSGSGSLSYEIEKITGDATITSSGAFTFVKPGTVWVKVQKAKSQVGDIYYEQSKILILEVNLEQSQVWIRVQNDINKNVGEEIPSPSSAGYLVEGLLQGDSLSRNPDIYFVYQSDDFYKFDILSQANCETRSNNGIQYTNNADGSWKITGRLTGTESVYNLILSNTEIPYYIDRSHKYLFRSTGLTSSLRIRVTWYFSTDNSIVSLVAYYNSSRTEFIIPLDNTTDSTLSRKLVGFSIQFLVTTSSQLNKTVTVKILDETEEGRFIDTSREGSYPISAKNGQIPNNVNEGYKSKIQYRSKNLTYTSENIHTLYYGMFLYDSGLGNLSDITYGLSISQTSASSRTKIVMHVKSPAGTYFQDGWTNTYITGDGSHPDFDDLWEPGVEVCLGMNGSFSSGFFQILGSTHGDTNISQQVPFHRISAETDSSDTTKIYEGTYEFMMPSSTVMISIVSYYVVGSIYYRYYPYCDVGISGDPLIGPAVVLPSTIYRDALMFCRWARQQYFGEVDAVPLMQGRTADTGVPYSGWFYVANPTAYSDSYDSPIVRHYVTRKEVCWVLRRMTHDTEYSGAGESIETISRYPDAFFELRASYQKDPNARLFEYAGYPPENGVTVEWTQNLEETFSYDALYGDNLRWKPYVVVPDPDNPGQYKHINEGTIDDYLYNYSALSTLSWNAWIGVLNGMSNTVSAPESFASFQEIATLLWRYAKFRQFDVMGDRAYQEVDDSTASEWAKNGPIKWLISRGITTGYHVATSINPLGGQKMKPQDYIDRADFAYMIMKFCQMYAW